MKWKILSKEDYRFLLKKLSRDLFCNGAIQPHNAKKICNVFGKCARYWECDFEDVSNV